jgi:hypothetical protein
MTLVPELFVRRLNKPKGLPINVRDVSVTGDGQTDDYAALNEAVRSAGATGTLYFPAGTYVVGTNLTIPACCIFAFGAKLKPSSGMTVTLSGPVELAPGESVIATGTAGTVSITGVIESSGGVLDVRAFGAKGDGVTDDTAAIQRAVTASANGTLLFPSGYTFLLSDDIDVLNPITITGYGSTVLQGATNRAAFTINASDVSFYGLRIRGPQYMAYNAAQFGLNFSASSWAAKISRITVQDCRIDRWGNEGIRLSWVSDFEVLNCTIEQVNYAGVLCLSVSDGRIAGNHIEDVPGTPNAYGITLTRSNNDSLTTHPRSQRVSVSGNTIRNIPVWNGIDTHGGADITITNNVVESCLGPIWCVDARNGSNVATFAPQRVVVSNNVITNPLSTGAAGPGVIVAGADSGIGSVTEYATGIVVSNNTIYRHGEQNADGGAAIRLQSVQGAVISGNMLVEPSPNGITLSYECLNASIVGNVVLDCWSDSREARLLSINNDNCTAYVSGNAVRRGTKSATNVNTQGVFVFGGSADCAVQIGENDWSGCSGGTVRDAVGGSVRNFKTISTTPYTVVREDRVLLVDASGGARTVTIPAGIFSDARILTIKKIDSSGNAVTVSRSSSDLIDGASTYSLPAQWDTVTVGSDGSTNWYVLGIGN